MQATKNNKSAAYPKNISVIGTKTGKCQLCKETKKLYLLRYGFTLCEDCVNICTSILEQLQTATEQKSKENRKPAKQKTSFCENSHSTKSVIISGRKTNDSPKKGTLEV